jgi:polysaccharide biosynthesis protein PslH
MRILFLTQIVPYPPDAGPKVKTWNVLRHLASGGHQITLVTFVRPEEEQFLPVLRELCSAVYPIPLHRSRLADIGYLGLSYLKQTPFLVERDNKRLMQEVVDRFVESGAVDIIHADQFTMAQFALKHTTLPRVFDTHNATWKLVERSAERYPLVMRIFLRRETELVKKYENRVIRSFAHTFTVTPIDRDFLLELFPPAERETISTHINSTPISVDCDTISPIQRKAGSFNIVTLGTLHYPPNADGIRWFIQSVFPLVLEKLPQAHLTVIGKNPPDDFLHEAGRIPGSLTVTGYVPDLKPYFSDAAVIVVPVRNGGGMRVRILEAFAYGMPVITTSAGLEGIDANVDHDILVKDDPVEFAAAIVHLIQNPELQDRLAINGRKLAEEKYHWRVALRLVDQVYEKIKRDCIKPD